MPKKKPLTDTSKMADTELSENAVYNNIRTVLVTARQKSIPPSIPLWLKPIGT